MACHDEKGDQPTGRLGRDSNGQNFDNFISPKDHNVVGGAEGKKKTSPLSRIMKPEQRTKASFNPVLPLWYIHFLGAGTDFDFNIHNSTNE